MGECGNEFRLILFYCGIQTECVLVMKYLVEGDSGS